LVKDKSSSSGLRKGESDCEIPTQKARPLFERAGSYVQ
jgi:hypothetical protein